MCNATVYQFLSGFIVGVALCFYIVGVKMRNADDTKELIGVPLEVAESSILLKVFRNWIKLNEKDWYKYEGNKLPEVFLDSNNRTVITCLVPFLGEHKELDQTESEIIVTWVETCDHVVFLRNRHTPAIQKTLEKLLFKRHTSKKMSVGYFYVAGNMSTADDNTTQAEQWIKSQYKAVEFAYKKYADSSLYIITPNTSDTINYFSKILSESSRDEVFGSLQNLLSTNSSINSNAVLKLDKSLLIGKKAVSKLIKMTNSNRCTFKSQRVFGEWAYQCIKTSNEK
ncbi:uncharacterized protein LOC123532638 [Mercenaria mercenaria]|uniref:uncharacterized protein LOC123532638 n=1 Tax=Mercenaria mercenaria TaxID=6596 RepID=UPI00234EF277|nr:uncharacterized protein LOC123532638 [Mercenaria mercenaria]